MAMHHLVASDIYIEIERITYMAYKKNCAFLGFFFWYLPTRHENKILLPV